MRSELTVEQRGVVAVARHIIVTRSPYLATPLWRHRIQATDEEKGAATPHGLILLSVQDLTEGNEREVANTIEHHLWHFLRFHHPRLSFLASKVAANLAGCIELNGSLNTGEPNPGTYNFPEGLLAEEYYDLLLKMADPDDLPDQGCGSGAGGTPHPDEPYDDQTDGISEAEQDLLRRSVAQQIREGGSDGTGRGNMPAGMKRWVDDVLEPVVHWSQHLIGILGSVASQVTGNADRSWHRPNRRQASTDHFLRPSRRSDRVVVGIVVDTSGSMGEADLKAALTEVEGLIKASGAAIVVSCDAEASEATETVRWDSLNLVGGGGTDMTAGIAALIADGRPDVIIVMTDGDTGWPEVDPGTPVIVLLTRPTSCPTPEWAQTIKVYDERNR